MNKQFLVELETSVTTPITVEASSESEAREKALDQDGEFGDISYSDAEIIRCQPIPTANGTGDRS